MRAAICIVLAVLAMGVGRAAQAYDLPDGFALEPVIGEPFAGYPTGFAFLPDGRILVIEKETGNVRCAAAGASVSAVIGTVPGISFDNERGLLGIAVDPAWPQRPYVYLMATYADGKSRVTMHETIGDVMQPASDALELRSGYVLLDYIQNVFPNHKGGTLRFGPDGLLYASVGDDGDVCQVQNLDAYNGKLLRLDVATMPGAGTGPPPMSEITPAANPFFGATPSARLVFAFGLRNPFRFTIDTLQGDVYIADVGAHAWEEIDKITLSGYTGTNFGWPFYEAGLFIPRSCDSAPPFVPPIYAYPHQSPNPQAVIAGPLYRGVQGSPLSFPPEYEGSYFLHDHYDGWIRRLVESHGDWFVAPPVAGQPDADNWATEMAHIADMQTGADGALYLMVLVGEPGIARGLHRIVNTIPSDAAGAAGPALRAVPNPGRIASGVTFHLGAARAAASTLHLYDTRGRLVRTLRPTSPRVHWDGLGDDGRPVAPGLYVYSRRTGDRITAAGKVLLVR